MSKILVTGGAGFIGSHLVEFLSKKNLVVVLDSFLHGNKIEKFNKNIQVVKGDVKDFSLVKDLSRNCSTIFHLAAILGVEVVAQNNLETIECEFTGLKNVCAAAKISNVKKIIYTSSSGVYGKLNYKHKVKENALIAPASVYAMAKRMGEFYLKSFQKEHGISSIVLRLFNVYGPRQDKRMVIPRFIDQAIHNRPMTVFGTGRDTRDFTYIDDCIKVFDLINIKLNGFEILNISKGKDYNINSLAKNIKKKLNSNSKIQNIKIPEKLQEYQVPKRCGDSSKILKLLNYKPLTSLDEGLEKLINYLEKKKFDL
jgi:nucleoside-diphosphate-sugar epimerase